MLCLCKICSVAENTDYIKMRSLPRNNLPLLIKTPEKETGFLIVTEQLTHSVDLIGSSLGVRDEAVCSTMPLLCRSETPGLLSFRSSECFSRLGRWGVKSSHPSMSWPLLILWLSKCVTRALQTGYWALWLFAKTIHMH